MLPCSLGNIDYLAVSLFSSTEKNNNKKLQGEANLRVVPISCILIDKMVPFGSSNAAKVFDLHNLR